MPAAIRCIRHASCVCRLLLSDRLICGQPTLKLTRSSYYLPRSLTLTIASLTWLTSNSNSKEAERARINARCVASRCMPCYSQTRKHKFIVLHSPFLVAATSSGSVCCKAERNVTASCKISPNFIPKSRGRVRRLISYDHSCIQLWTGFYKMMVFRGRFL